MIRIQPPSFVRDGILFVMNLMNKVDDYKRGALNVREERCDERNC
ncbi:hypothetical protein VDIAB_30139 [Vibrio diabolicus]|nr:hypothetical protein VDIAB_30139 [Vibrio diabolicus]